jgi:hypothetical protein
MKIIRLIIIMIISGLVLSAWTPATAFAKAEEDQVIFVTGLNGDFGGANVANLTVDNRTGGSLFISLKNRPYDRRHSTPIDPKFFKSYLLLAPKQGKNQYQIMAGIYTFTIRSSNCGGQKLDTKLFKGDVKLGPYYCDK